MDKRKPLTFHTLKDSSCMLFLGELEQEQIWSPLELVASLLFVILSFLGDDSANKRKQLSGDQLLG
jgi:hypothetical protein